MKHSLKITLILLGMFILAQLIGLAVINAYSPSIREVEINGTIQNVTYTPELPYGMQPPEIKPEFSILSIAIAMIIAVFLIFILMRFKAKFFIKLWFFVVVILALGLAINSLFMYFTSYSAYLALIIAIPLAIFKIYKRNMIVHNLTELLIYPGIAAVFVPILSVWTSIILLLLISVYDIYAVWHAGFMQKMAKYHINELNIFPGFFLPNADKETKLKIKLLKQKYKNNIPDKIVKKSKIKVNLAILGGGDVVFPIIFAGVILIARGLLPALLISLFAAIALFLLFVFARKGKFYPAMPFLTSGCLVGFLIGLIF